MRSRCRIAAAAILTFAFSTAFWTNAKPWRRNIAPVSQSLVHRTRLDFAPDFFDKSTNSESKWLKRPSPFHLEHYRYLLPSDETVPLLYVHGHGGTGSQGTPVFSAIVRSTAGKLRVLLGFTHAAQLAVKRMDMAILEKLRREIPPQQSLLSTWLSVREALERESMRELTELDVAAAVAFVTHGKASVTGTLAATRSYWLTSSDTNEKRKVQYLLSFGEKQMNYKLPQWKFMAVDMNQWPSALHGEFVEIQSHAVWNALNKLQSVQAPNPTRAVLMAFSMGGIVTLRALAGAEWRDQIERRIAAIVLINTPILVHPLLETAVTSAERKIAQGLRRLKAQGNGMPLDPILVRLQTAELDEAVWGLRGDLDFEVAGIFKSVFTADLSQVLSSAMSHGDTLYGKAAVSFLAEMFQILGDYAAHQTSRQAAEDNLEQFLGGRGVPKFSGRKYDKFTPSQSAISLPLGFLPFVKAPPIKTASLSTVPWWVFDAGRSKSVASISLIMDGEHNAMIFPSEGTRTIDLRKFSVQSLSLGSGTFEISRNNKSSLFIQLHLNPEFPIFSIVATLVSQTPSVTLNEVSHPEGDARDDYLSSEAFPPCTVSSDGDLRGLSLQIHSEDPQSSTLLKFPLRIVPSVLTAYPAAACVWQLSSNQPWSLYEPPLAVLDSITHGNTSFELVIDLPSNFKGYMSSQVIFGTAWSEAVKRTPNRFVSEVTTLVNVGLWLWSILFMPLRLKPTALFENEPQLAKAVEITAPSRTFQLLAPELNWDIAWRPSRHESEVLQSVPELPPVSRRLLEQAVVWPHLVLISDDDFGTVSGRYLDLPAKGQSVLSDGGIWRSTSKAGAFNPPNSNSRFATYRRGVFPVLRHESFAEYPGRRLRAHLISSPLRQLLLGFNQTLSSGELLYRGAADRWWRESVRGETAQMLRLIAVRAMLGKWVHGWAAIGATAAFQVGCWMLSGGSYSVVPDDAAIQRELQPGQALSKWLFPSVPLVWALHEILVHIMKLLAYVMPSGWIAGTSVTVLSILLPWEWHSFPVIVWVSARARHSKAVLGLLGVGLLWHLPDALGFWVGRRILPWRFGVPPLLLLVAGWRLRMPDVTVTVIILCVGVVLAASLGNLSSQWLVPAAWSAVAVLMARPMKERREPWETTMAMALLVEDEKAEEKVDDANDLRVVSSRRG